MAERKKMKPKKKKWLIATAVLLVLALLFGLWWFGIRNRNGGGYEGPMGMEVVMVEQQNMSQSISVTGKVASQKAMSVSSDFSAKVKTLNVDLGDQVNKGDVLLTFDVSDINEQIKTLEKQVSASEKAKAWENTKLQKALNQAVSEGNASVKEAAAEADAAYAVWAKLAADPEAETDEVEEAKASYYAAEKAVNATVKEANAAVEAAQDAIDDATYAEEDEDTTETTKELVKLYRQRNNATVKTEQSGIITQLNVSVGSTTEGTLMRIEDNHSLAIQVGVKTKDIVRLEKGMRAEITTDAFPDETFGGTVSKVIIFTSSDTGAASPDMGESDSGDGYRATIDIQEDAKRLLLGMNVKVKIILSEGEEAMTVPYDSIVEEDDASYVYRVTPTSDDMDENGNMQGTVEKVNVVPGTAADYYTSVTSDELNMGDYVVSCPDMVSEGDTVDFYVSSGMDFTEETEE